MKIGVRAHDFGRHSIESLPQIIKTAGFDCVQLAPAKAIIGINSFSEITDQAIDEIGESFAKHNLEIAILGCYIEPSVIDKEQRLNQVHIFKQNLSFAKRLGVQFVGTETTHLCPYTTTDDQREESYTRLKDSVLRMIDHAEKENVCVALEPVADHTLNTPQLAHRLLGSVGSRKLHMIFDPVNMILPTTWKNQNKIYHDFFALLGRRICAFHAKDTTFSGETESDEKIWANIGEGVVNYELIMPYLKENHPHLPILREVAQMDSYTKDLEKLQQFIQIQ